LQAAARPLPIALHAGSGYRLSGLSRFFCETPAQCWGLPKTANWSPDHAAAIIAVRLYRRQPILSDFVTGGQEGLQVTLKILPNVMAMLIDIGIFRAIKP
jgi:hypothetical protein